MHIAYYILVYAKTLLSCQINSVSLYQYMTWLNIKNFPLYRGIGMITVFMSMRRDQGKKKKNYKNIYLLCPGYPPKFKTFILINSLYQYT